METFGKYTLSELNRPIFGLYVSISDPALIEMAAYAGFGFVRIDLEHTLFSYEKVAELIRTARLLNMETQVRISSITDITKLLDQGATSIICPDIETPAMAREVVNKTKYYPLGGRGMFPVSRFLEFGAVPFAPYAESANRTVLAGVQIESVQALESIDEILKTDGVDIVASGKADLSQSMGLIGQASHPKVIEAENFIVKKALEYGKLPSMLANNKKRVHELWDLGVKLITIGPDVNIVANCYKSMVEQLF